MTQGSRVVLITGTSSGFGRLLTVALAQDGWQVVATMRNLDRRTALEEAVRRAGATDRVHIRKLDVTDCEQVSRVIEDAASSFGRIDALINNAGIAVGGFFEDVPLDQWRQQFDTNVFGAVACIQAVLPHMRRQGGGTIINMSSLSGRIGYPGLGPYTASKFALEGLTETLRLELYGQPIRVVLVEPGPYKTEIWEKSLAAAKLPDAEDQRARRMRRRVERIAETAGNPEEVVRLIRRILADDRPKLRYPIGRGVRFAAWLKGCAPWSWIERAVGKSL